MGVQAAMGLAQTGRQAPALASTDVLRGRCKNRVGIKTAVPAQADEAGHLHWHGDLHDRALVKARGTLDFKQKPHT